MSWISSWQAIIADSRRLAVQYGWVLMQLDRSCVAPGDMLQTLLEEAIASREQGSPEFSLALMECALAQGVRSPWLHDNRARALVELERFEDALHAWSLMEKFADSDYERHVAQQMMAGSRAQADLQMRQRLDRERIERFAHYRASGEISSAVSELVLGILESPKNVEIEKKLMDLLDYQRQQQDLQWSSVPYWLQRHELALEASSLKLLKLRSLFSV